ncbi:MAG: hypothetical protein NVS9B14_21460 [Candidatus Acidiferrum sp.]
MATARMAPVTEAPCEAFFFDVETMNPSPEVMAQIEKQWLAEWEPPKNYKDPAAIEAKRLEELDKFRERAALHDAAPVAMVGLMFEQETFLLHSLKSERAKWFGKNGAKNRVSIEGFAGERELMEMVCKLIARKTELPQRDSRGKTIHEGTRGVGHNVYGFDLGKIRLAIVRNGLPLPEFFRVLHVEDEDRQQFVDTMRMYCRYFAKSGQMFITQDAMLENLGITPQLKGVATGADVPKLLAAGKLTAVAAKLLADLVGVREAFVRMTGRAR